MTAQKWFDFLSKEAIHKFPQTFQAKSLTTKMTYLAPTPEKSSQKKRKNGKSGGTTKIISKKKKTTRSKKIMRIRQSVKKKI